jgi:type I site-specific restriction endonuclease
MQQAIEYSEILQIRLFFTSNGDSFVFFHVTKLTIRKLEKKFPLDDFPSPEYGINI